MTNWAPGMKAVCVAAKPIPYQSLTIGRVYTVRNVHACVHGIVVLDVGLVSRLPYPSGYTRFSECGCRAYGEWKLASRFRPLLGDEQEALDAIEQEVKETELIPEPA